jgi:high-affinity nickel permease
VPRLSLERTSRLRVILVLLSSIDPQAYGYLADTLLRGLVLFRVHQRCQVTLHGLIRKIERDEHPVDASSSSIPEPWGTSESTLMNTPLNLVLLSCAFLGFRHGFDYDHIAAITDIAGMQTGISRTMRLSLMYALGHAATVAVLGGIVIGFQLSLPAEMDRWAERLVGVTLILLALYVLNTLIRHRGRQMPRSRASLILGAGSWLHRRTKRWLPGSKTKPDSVRQPVTSFGCFVIGIIHGLGAETPSQLALFLMASNLGGVERGLAGLGFFLLGLLLMNTLMAASTAGLFRAGHKRRRWNVFFAGLTAVYSLLIGIIFLLGYSGHMKNISS